MNKVKITAVRKTEYPDLMAEYENPIQHACDVVIGQSWISENGERPEGLCESAWGSMREFVEKLSEGEGNDGCLHVYDEHINSIVLENLAKNLDYLFGVSWL